MTENRNQYDAVRCGKCGGTGRYFKFWVKQWSVCPECEGTGITYKWRESLREFRKRLNGEN